MDFLTMRNTQAQSKGMTATGIGNKTGIDMLSKQLPVNVTLTSENRENFSYNIGRKINKSNKTVRIDSTTEPEHKHETTNSQLNGNNKKASGELCEANVNEHHKENHTMQEPGLEATTGKLKSKLTFNHGKKGIRVTGNKTGNRAFENSIPSLRKSSKNQVKKQVDRGREIEQVSENIDNIVDSADGVNNRRNGTNGSSHDQHVNETINTDVSDGTNSEHAKKSMHLMLPSSGSESQALSPRSCDIGTGSADTSLGSRKQSLSQRSVVSFASSTESASSLFDKILESRAMMSSGSSSSLQDTTSCRSSFLTETTNRDERWEGKSDGNSSVNSCPEIGHNARVSPDKKHAPDTQQLDGENTKPITKRTKQRRIFET